MSQQIVSADVIKSQELAQDLHRGRRRFTNVRLPKITTMTPDEALRFLRLIRYAPRQPTIAWLASQSGYSPTALYDAVKRDWITQAMADRLEIAFQMISVSDGHLAFKNARLGDFPDGRGGARPGSGRKLGSAPEDKARTEARVTIKKVSTINDIAAQSR